MLYHDLVTHMEWADALMWRAASALPDPPASRLLERLYHVHVVQWVYLQAWRGEPADVPSYADLADLAAIRAWARPYYPSARTFVDATADQAFSRELLLPWKERIVERFGNAPPVTLGETIVQVAMHSEHHRAQIATLVRELGGDPPLTDFIAWIWQNRPAPEW